MEQRQGAEAREKAPAAMQKASAHAEEVEAKVEEMITRARPVTRATWRSHFAEWQGGEGMSKDKKAPRGASARRGVRPHNRGL